MSVPFDRAAAVYDRTRARTPASSAAITRLLGEQVQGRVLEPRFPIPFRAYDLR